MKKIKALISSFWVVLGSALYAAAANAAPVPVTILESIINPIPSVTPLNGVSIQVQNNNFLVTGLFTSDFAGGGVGVNGPKLSLSLASPHFGPFVDEIIPVNLQVNISGVGILQHDFILHFFGYQIAFAPAQSGYGSMLTRFNFPDGTLSGWVTNGRGEGGGPNAGGFMVSPSLSSPMEPLNWSYKAYTLDYPNPVSEPGIIPLMFAGLAIVGLSSRRQSHY